MELELNYKEFIENSNVIDSYWHYSELTEYINENFYKLPYTVSDIYMEEENKEETSASTNTNNDSKLDLMKGLGKVGKLVGSTLLALVKSIWNILIYVFQMALKLISFMLDSMANLLEFFTGSKIDDINESIKENFNKLNTDVKGDKKYYKLQDAIDAWFKPFKDADLNTKWAEVINKKSDDEYIQNSANNSLDFTLDEYFNEETSVQNINKLLKIVEFYEYQKELTKEHYQQKAAIVILLNNLINSNIVLNLIDFLKIAIEQKDSLKNNRILSKKLYRAAINDDDSAEVLKHKKELGFFFPDLIQNLSNIQKYAKTLNNSICSKNKIKGLINLLINQKQSKIDIDSIYNELPEIIENIYNEINEINQKINEDLVEVDRRFNFIEFETHAQIIQMNNKSNHKYSLKTLKEMYNKDLDHVKNLSKDFKKYSSQLGDLAKIKEIKFMMSTIKSLIPNIKMTNDYILKYQKAEKVIAISIKKYKEIHKSIQSIAKMSAD